MTKPTEEKRIEWQFLHSTHKTLKNPNNSKEVMGDVITACVKNIDTGEVQLVRKLNPMRPLYVLKRAFWNNTNDDETVERSKLDEFYVPNYQMIDNLKVKLGYNKNKWINNKDLLNDQRSFGNDIPIEAIMKQAYHDSTPRTCPEYRVGGLDIETSVLGGQEVILITYTTPELHSYTCMLKAFMQDPIEKIQQVCDDALKQWVANLNDDGRKVVEKYKLGITLKECQTEVEMIKWIFDMIHMDKPEFVGVWNINFDIPYLLKRLEFHKQSPYSIMCHPDVPWRERVCTYKEDTNKKVTHWSRRWHWFKLSGYTQFLDLQSLYSNLRVVNGVESSYALKYIADKNLGTSKLDFGEDGHAAMQKNRMTEYTAYNIVDTVILPVQDKVTRDVNSMVLIMREDVIENFVAKTIMLTDSFYPYCKQRNRIPASCSGNQNHITDEEIINVGGAVLNPLLAKGTGTKKVKELTGDTHIMTMVADIDVKSMYPHLLMMGNVAKETKISTVLAIEGFDHHAINDMFGHYCSPRENAVYLMNKFFGLPSFKDIDEILKVG